MLLPPPLITPVTATVAPAAPTTVMPLVLTMPPLPMVKMFAASEFPMPAKPEPLVTTPLYVAAPLTFSREPRAWMPFELLIVSACVNVPPPVS